PRACRDRCAAPRTATRCDRAAAASAPPGRAAPALADERSFHSREHFLETLDEEGRAFHDARLLPLHQRPDLGDVGLPLRIRRHRGAALVALVEALAGPHVRQVFQLHLHAFVLVVLEVSGSGAEFSVYMRSSTYIAVRL